MLIITEKEMEILKKLQSIEDESSEIKKTLGKVEDEISSRRIKLSDSEKTLKLSETSLGKIRVEYRDFEIEVDGRNARLKKSEEYIKTVTSNSEYQLLLREIDDNRKRNAELETQMIEYLDKIEVMEKEVRENTDEVTKISGQVSREISEIEQSTIDDRTALITSHEKRDKIAAELNQKLYKRFNNILERSSGKGIVPVVKSICGGCHMNIPPQMYIEVQRGEGLHFCPQCQRMLYYKEEE